MKTVSSLRTRNFTKFQGKRMSSEKKKEILNLSLEDRLSVFSEKKEFQLPGHNLPTAHQVLSGTVRHKRFNHADPIHLSKLFSDINDIMVKHLQNKTPSILMDQYFSEFEYLISRIKDPTIKLYGTTLLDQLRTEQ